MTDSGELTALFAAARNGDSAANDRILPLVYGELRRIAQNKMAREGSGHTLSATALVHEAYVKLFGTADIDWQNREHFFATAAEAMRRYLVDHARHKKTLKRGGGHKPKALEDYDVPAAREDVDVEALDEALTAFEAKDARAAQVVKLRYFVGLTIEETAEALNIAPRTVRADWTAGKWWLRRFLENDGDVDSTDR